MDGPARTRSVAEGITAIDTVMAGTEELNAAYLVHASEPCLIETGPGADHARVCASLDALRSRSGIPAARSILATRSGPAANSDRP